MRVSLAVSAATLLAAAPAAASVVTIGSSHAVTCYQASEQRRVDSRAFFACDTALATEALDRRDRAATLVNRGILYMLAGSPARAAQDFDAAIAIHPVEPESYLNKAVLAWRAGDSANARQLAGAALDRKTRKPAYALYIRGIANEEQGNLAGAYADFRRAADLAPGWRDPRTELARYRLVGR